MSDTHSSTSLLGHSGAASQRPLLLSPRSLRRLLVLLAFLTSVFGLLPTALRMLAGPNWLRDDVLYGACFLLLLVAAYLGGSSLRAESRQRRRLREQARREERVSGGTYRCVQPQILNTMVVFPLRVRRRDAGADAVVELDDDCLTVELAQGSEGECVDP
ncbi:hypothetical protein TeGR_g5282 [Tetraparma gracilis]|uniref:Uncharacterized protein n=1 Tax=Tetraparma gracilis TaxID=2962635 RepID=A0ABQ6MY64_9STRA|nr:hypothetical protein TeGR_g5282 [Tetraparma gracilis]